MRSTGIVTRATQWERPSPSNVLRTFGVARLCGYGRSLSSIVSFVVTLRSLDRPFLRRGCQTPTSDQIKSKIARTHGRMRL